MSNLSNDHIYELKDLTKQFLELAKEMKEKNIISKEQYDDMIRSKVEFLRELSDEKITY